MNRRNFLQRSSAFAGMGVLTGCAHHIVPASTPTAPSFPWYDAMTPITPIRADLDRIFRITVCTRPFRATGPRLDAERIGDKLVIHNYGHGGSGWSLSWGSAQVVVNKALETSTGKDLAVLGCGALGLTAAVTAQRAGFRTTIYARERPPFVRSSNATGSWTPDSRVALANAITPEFAAQWESMARHSFKMYQSFLGSPGNPVEFTDRYYLDDLTEPQRHARPSAPPPEHEFAYLHKRLVDQEPSWHPLPPGAHPFPVPYAARTTQLTFNIADYSRQLLNDFQTAGGQIETREFHAPADLAALPQPTILNCTGYGARALFSDESIVPIRGQIAWLIPQEGTNYGLYYKDLIVLARRDGIVIQTNPQGDDTGWNNASEVPDRAAAEAGVRQLQALYDRMTPPPKGIHS